MPTYIHTNRFLDATFLEEDFKIHKSGYKSMSKILAKCNISVTYGDRILEVKFYNIQQEFKIISILMFKKKITFIFICSCIDYESK